MQQPISIGLIKMKTASRIFETQDGSHSIFSEGFGVSYHSRYGAIQESQHVFIEAALYYKIAEKRSGPLHILEIGLGTGLNAFMSLLEAEKRHIAMNYLAVEAYPITLEEAEQLNYPQKLQAEDKVGLFREMHRMPWDEARQIHPYFIFEKIQQRFEELSLPSRFDIIYFDAFAPNAQPELWEPEIMQIMYDALKADGVLTTYCAKGVVKRNLRSIGFEVESLPGPPGKREMTRAIKRI